MNAMSCYICGEDGEVGVRALCREHQERLPLLEAENARLQTALETLKLQSAESFEKFIAVADQRDERERERDRYKALAERRGEALEEAEKLVRILGRSLTECSAPSKDIGGLIHNRRQLALLRLRESE